MRGQRSHQGYGLVYTDSLGISHNAPTSADGLKNGFGYCYLSGMGDHLNDEIFDVGWRENRVLGLKLYTEATHLPHREGKLGP